MTNGNLTAPKSTTINGEVLDNGVYNYGGEFPIASQYYANFWVDVAFSPSASSSASVKPAAVAAPTSGSAAVAIGRVGLHHHHGRIGHARRGDGHSARIKGNLIIDRTATAR